MIPYGRQDISEADIQAVVDVLKSEFLTQGPAVPAFEKAVSDYCDVQYAIAVNSATSALHIACLALGVGKGDWVWTSPITFVASANCALYCGADVDFVDIDETTYNISVSVLEEKLIRAEKEGRLPKVVIPVHLAGQSCEMDKIYALGQKYGFRIIEDASHAIGGKYKGKAIGGCQYSDITVFSFHPVKIITTGEGGMCVTNDSELATRLIRFRSHGIVRHPSEMTKLPDGPWHYQQIALGYNYRMTDIHAALGLSQMKKLDQFVESRHKLANKYDELLKEDWLHLPWQHPDSYSSLHLYVIRVKSNKKSISHLQLFQRLRTAGILVNLHYIPVYHHPYYESLGLYNKADFQNAELYYKEAISIPIYPSLRYEELYEVVDRIIKPTGFQNLF
jgi:UDP-4-amino-4,6-dideoxy-N-acetyl-beta-L-altrosamine transaminase